MYNINASKDIQENYQALYMAISAHMEDEGDVVANLANISAFLYQYLPDVNWAGFYLLKGGELVLGPFAGKPACTRIALGRGVCGVAARDGRVIVVPDVHVFDGHIACDGETNSEIVLPIYKGDAVFGVLDIDSPVLNRFDEIDEDYLRKIADIISKFLEDTNECI